MTIDRATLEHLRADLTAWVKSAGRSRRMGRSSCPASPSTGPGSRGCGTAYRWTRQPGSSSSRLLKAWGSPDMMSERVA